MNSATLNFIVQENLPFDIVSRKSFKDLLHLANPKIMQPTKQNIMKLLLQEEIQIRKNLKEVLSKQEHVCTTVDAWSSRGRSFLGMSVHFVEIDSMERKSYILSFRALKQKQEFKYLTQHMYAVHKSYGLLSKITHTVTDGGANICKSFRVFGKTDQSVELFPLTTVNESDAEEEEEEDNLECVDIDAVIKSLEGSNELPEDVEGLQIDLDPVNVSLEIGDALETDDEILTLPKHMRCFAHLLCLVGGSDFNKLIGKTSIANLIKQSFAKLHRFWYFTRKSARAKDICKQECGITFSIPNATRYK